MRLFFIGCALEHSSEIAQISVIFSFHENSVSVIFGWKEEREGERKLGGGREGRNKGKGKRTQFVTVALAHSGPLLNKHTRLEERATGPQFSSDGLSSHLK